MGTIDKTTLLAARTRRPVKIEIDVPGLRGEAYIRGLSATAAYLATDLPTRDRAGYIIAEALCDESGEPFEWSEADRAALGELSVAVTEPIIKKVNELSGFVFGDDGDPEKNSASTRNGGS